MSAKKAWAAGLFLFILLLVGVKKGTVSADQFAPPPMEKPAVILTHDTLAHEKLVYNNMITPAAKPQQSPEISITEIAMSADSLPLPLRKPMKEAGEVMSRADALLYRQIFSAQSKADWQEADRLMAMLSDFRLRGHILFQRYMHPTKYVTKFDELKTWLDSYTDHPGARRIYNLALKKMPKNYKGALEKPETRNGISGYLQELRTDGKDYSTAKRRSQAQQDVVATLRRNIGRNISRGRPTAALELLSSADPRLLDPVEQDELLSAIANSYMIAGRYQDALIHASGASARSGLSVPRAGWVAGLVSWMNADYDGAARYFAQAAGSPYGSSWMKSAASYWAARSYEQAGNRKARLASLRAAASYPRTFYGLIAAQALGQKPSFRWDMPAYNPETLQSYDGVKRAMNLISSGQFHLADAELRLIPAHNRGKQEALLAFADQKGLPSYAMRLASAVRAGDGGLYDAALYPVMSWTPAGGYKVDKALIHAIIRQESKFDTGAENPSGATGLMQLMPQTATYVDRNTDFRSRAGRHSLKDPQRNLDLGQRYVRKLMAQPHVGDDLFALMIAYNAGPGNLNKWQNSLHHVRQDPLLFIELVPSAETRAFIERVAANYWIYRMRLGQDTPSLAQVANGKAARYARLDVIRPKPKQQALLTYPELRSFKIAQN